MQTLTPSNACLNGPALLRLRVWATSLRDASLPELASQCRTLIQLIDLRPRLKANNAAESVDRSILMLVGLLVVCGAGAPA